MTNCRRELECVIGFCCIRSTIRVKFCSEIECMGSKDGFVEEVLELQMQSDRRERSRCDATMSKRLLRESGLVLAITFIVVDNRWFIVVIVCLKFAYVDWFIF
jgi:hypothetical protein